MAGRKSEWIDVSELLDLEDLEAYDGVAYDMASQYADDGLSVVSIDDLLEEI
jgi:hypothetical protein